MLQAFQLFAELLSGQSLLNIPSQEDNSMELAAALVVVLLMEVELQQAERSLAAVAALSLDMVLQIEVEKVLVVA